MQKNFMQPYETKSEMGSESNQTPLFLRWTSPLRKLVAYLFTNVSLLLFLFGLLLGRAMILGEMSPFALAYFGAIYHIKREKSLYAFLGALAGGVFSSVDQGWLIVLSIAFYYILEQLFRILGKDDITYAPILTPIASLAGGLIYTYFAVGEFTAYGLIMRGVESVLAMVLCFIFIQSFPLFIHRHHRYQLKQEEIICLLILFASLMTGTVGWYINEFSVEHIVSRYLILILALVGGGTVGATVGVITGLILSLADVEALAQMSLLGFSGLLAGLFRDGKKVGVGLGMLMGTSILTVYTGERLEMWTSTVETLLAILVFFATPKIVIDEMAKYIPWTKEHHKTQQETMRRIRVATAERVQQFAEVFRQLSKSFRQTLHTTENLDDVKTDYFLSDVTDKTCQRCWKKEQCWTKQFDYTYHNMKEMMRKLDAGQGLKKQQLPTDWRNMCVKIDRLIAVMSDEHEKRKQAEKLDRRVKEARLLVADQLFGVSKVMLDFSNEITKETEVLSVQEEQIMEALASLGLKIQSVEILDLTPGKVDIRIGHPSCNGRKECEKIIAPMLSEILKETIVVSPKGCAISDGHCVMQLVSGNTYDVTIGVAQAAKGGGLVCGDSYATLDLGNGKYAVAISDGMGNGKRAYHESSATIQLLQQILQSGLDENLAVKTVNTVLALRSTDEVFATVDLALIDLHNANTKFLKIGSSPSFIKRGPYVTSISANNLPIGIIEDIEIDVVTENLKSGDLLIMVTDGIYEAGVHLENQEMWLKRIIRDLETDEPQEVADLILEEVIRNLHYQIADDMTVVVAKIDHFKPKWASIAIPNPPKIQRGKVARQQ